MPAFRERQGLLAARLAEAGIFALVLEDFEGVRSRSLRYLCGHPTDAILFVFASGKTVLVPWDVNMAHERAQVDTVIPYTDFKRSFRHAAASVLRDNGLETGGGARKVEVPGRTPHARYRELASELARTEVLCGEVSDGLLSRMRTIKDAGERAALERAGEITNAVLERVSTLISTGAALTEIDLAHAVEREALSRGAEGLGFETLAAGPRRSWGIHPFPVSSAGPFATAGLSILDFGISVDGYTSDVTITVAAGRLSGAQERMLDLVQRAYDQAVAACRAGRSPQAPARAAEAVFSSEGWSMPHALGHGIGLDAHEGPLIRSLGEPSDPELVPGMAFTVEPGLYHPEHGGVRLENDVLMTEAGPRVLTASRILRI